MLLFNIIYWFAEKLILAKSYPAWLWDRVKSITKPSPQRTIIRQIQGRQLLDKAERLCLFSHFDKAGLIAEHVRNYIEKLAELGFIIIFVSNSPNLLESETKKILSHVAKVMVRKNEGYDFGAWKTALTTLPRVSNYTQILLANDSVYGPLFDLAPVFASMENKKFDIWGITDSWVGSYHLQSYFLLFNQTAIQSRFFEKFWRSVRFLDIKKHLIYQYELGLSRQAMRYGLRLGAFCCYHDILSTDHNRIYKDIVTKAWEKRKIMKITLALARLLGIKHPLSPDNQASLSYLPLSSVHFFWRQLIEAVHCPFMKIELLRHNPTKIENRVEWQTVIKKNSNYPISWITDHLQR